MMQEGFSFPNTKAATLAFVLTLGGRYMFTASGTFTSAAVQVEDAAGNFEDIFGAFNNAGTEVNLKIATLTAAGAMIVDLPPGSYQFALAGNSSTAANVGIARCPLC